MNVTVKHLSPDELKEETWEFWFHDGTRKLVLDKYERLERVSKRHKFVQRVKYSRLNVRESNLASADVPLPNHVKEEAILKYTSGISVELWEDVAK